MDTTLDRPPIGQLLDGRYRVESHLADGGMATIYLGTDTRLDRRVALKVMRAEFASDEDFVRRFVAEARSVASLSNPNVVTVYDQGADGRFLYLAMEYVPGRTLRDLLRERGRLSPREALDIMDGVLAGLAAAHQAGLAHRDVKPENVLLATSGSVKVADFGLARLVASGTHTRTGMIIGTAAYLAPEQVSGAGADARTDVYAAGVMLFELLTGTQPHTGDTPLAVAYKHVNEVVPPPSSVVPGLPPALDALVALATSRDPDLRPGDAGQFLHAITSVRHGQPLGAFAPGRRGGPGGGTHPGIHPGAHPGTSPARQPTFPGHDWPDEADAPTVHNLIPGMAPAARQPFGMPGGPSSGTRQFPPDPYRPGVHKTLIVGAAAGEAYSPGPGRSGGPREPRLQRLLFSRRLGYLLLGIAAVVIIGSLVWWQAAGRYTKVPSVDGMSLTAARTELKGLGFAVTTGTPQFDNQVGKGEVVRSVPGPGARLAKGGKITLILSAGPHMITMPQVTGQPLAQAEAMLRQHGLTPGRTQQQPSATLAAGTVISTRPGAGTSWPQAEPVTLVVSAGPPLPNFVGQQQAVAQAWAAQSGVKLDPIPVNSDQPTGTVTHQSPAAGSVFTSGEVLILDISNGPKMVPIPNVDGQGVNQATHTLGKLGFQVQVSQTGPFHVVYSYNPSGQAPQGSVITLYVGLPSFGSGN